MKLLPSFRLALLAGALPLAILGTARAQSPSPSATASPGSTASPAPSPQSAGDLRKELLDRYDRNHDGVLDAEERSVMDKDRASRKADRLKKYDKNHDGKLDESERATMRADRENEKAAASPAAATPKS